MPMDASALADEIERQRPSLVGLLASLVRTDTTNPPGDTRRAVELIGARFRKLGVDFQILADDPKKPNLLLRLGSGRPELLFNTHMDTVPPGDRTTWRHDPLGAQIEGTRLFGRGAADPKGGVGEMVGSVETLVRLRVWLRGLLRPDQVTIGEVTHNRIAIAEKGLLWVRLVTRGRTAHGSTPWKGVNAVRSLVKVLAALEAGIGGPPAAARASGRRAGGDPPRSGAAPRRRSRSGRDRGVGPAGPAHRDCRRRAARARRPRGGGGAGAGLGARRLPGGQRRPLLPPARGRHEALRPR